MPGETADHRELDVRDVDEPFGAITGALSELEEDETLHLRNDFEPEPLYSVLEDRGFEYEAIDEGATWRIVIERR